MSCGKARFRGESVAAAEAGILLKAYAALKRRSSTVLHRLFHSAARDP